MVFPGERARLLWLLYRPLGAGPVYAGQRGGGGDGHSPGEGAGKRPRIVRDNGSQFVAKEWREVVRHFELEDVPISVRHPEFNGRMERYHRSVREEAFGDREAEDLYRGRDLLGRWVRYYNEERLHSALNYLRLVDYYRGNPEALVAERGSKLKAAAARRKEVNRLILTETMTGV